MVIGFIGLPWDQIFQMFAAGFWKPLHIQVVGIPPETRMQINGPISKVWAFLIPFTLLLIIPNYQKL